METSGRESISSSVISSDTQSSREPRITISDDRDVLKLLPREGHFPRSQTMLLKCEGARKSMQLSFSMVNLLKKKGKDTPLDGVKKSSMEVLTMPRSGSFSALSRSSSQVLTPGSRSSLEGGDDAFRLFSRALLTEETQLSILWKESSMNVKIDPSSDVSTVIRGILAKFNISKTSTTNLHEESLDLALESKFRLCRKDRQNAGMRTWLKHSDPISLYYLQHGDELVLQSITEEVDLFYTVPPSDQKISIKYRFESTPKDLIQSIRETVHFETINCGLYNPRLGIWLDLTKTLFSYDLTDQCLQFRVKANEFLLRIMLDDFDQKIGLKVLPSFRISDVLSAVEFQIQNRRLVHSKKGYFGLLLEEKWLASNAELSTIPEIQIKTLIYRIHKQSISVKTANHQYEQVLIDANTTVGHILRAYTKSRKTIIGLEYALLSADGDILDTSKNIITLMKDMGLSDSFQLSIRPKPIQIHSKHYPDFTWTLNADISKPFSYYRLQICRKFGFSAQGNLQLSQGDQIISFEESIADIKIGDGVVLDLDYTLAEEQTKIDENTDCKDAASMSDLRLYTLDQLIEQLTVSHTSDLDFVKTFLLTYKSFTSGSQLIEKLISRYSILNSGPKRCWSEYAAHRQFIQLRVGNVLLQWIKKYPYDFAISQEICTSVIDFLDEVLNTDHAALSKQIRRHLGRVKETLDVQKKQISLKFNIDPSIFSPDRNASLYRHSIQAIADQMTLIESELYSNILPSEILNQAWMNSDAQTLAPGIIALSKRFNSVARWVVQSILEMKTPKERGERMNKIIELADHLVARNNYSTLMAVIAGINKSSITRLKASQKEMSSKSIKRKAELELLMSAIGSYKRYRAQIASLAPPIIPYIGTYLTDLTYIEDGNHSTVCNKINFTKREMISKVIRALMDYQQVPYDIKPQSEIISILNSFPEAVESQEKEFYQISKTLE